MELMAFKALILSNTPYAFLLFILVCMARGCRGMISKYDEYVATFNKSIKINRRSKKTTTGNSYKEKRGIRSHTFPFYVGEKCSLIIIACFLFICFFAYSFSFSKMSG